MPVPAMQVLSSGLLCLVFCVALPVWAAEPVTCEQRVQDETQQLVTDQLLPPVPPAAPWLAQLAAVTRQVRVLTTQYMHKRQQAEQAEGSAAVLVEQVRELQRELAKLTPPPPSTN